VGYVKEASEVRLAFSKINPLSVKATAL